MATRKMPQSSFSSTAERWFELTKTNIENEDDGDVLEAIDQLLLSRKPTSDLEVLVLMDVVAEAVRGGGRLDGLDVRALLNVRDRILTASTEVGLGESYAALQSRVQWPTVEQRRTATG
jgi:hypothetical protein